MVATKAVNKKRKATDPASCDLLKQVELFKRVRTEDLSVEGLTAQLKRWETIEGGTGREIAKLERSSLLSDEMKKICLEYQRGLLVQGRCATSCWKSLRVITEAMHGMVDEVICLAQADIFAAEGSTMRDLASELAVAFGCGSARWSVRGTGGLFDKDDNAHVDRLAIRGTTLCLVLSIYPSLKAFPFLSLDGSVRELTAAEKSEHPLWRLVSQRSTWPMAEDHHQVLLDVSFVVADVSDEEPSAGGAGSSANNLKKYTVNACSMGFPTGMSFENVERPGLTASVIAKEVSRDAVYVVGPLDFSDVRLQWMRNLVLEPHPTFCLEGEASAFATLFTVEDEYVEGPDMAVENRIKNGILAAEHNPDATRIIVAMYGSRVVGLDISTRSRHHKADSWEKLFVGVLKEHRGRGLSHAMIDCFESTLVEKPGQGTRMTVTVPSCLVGEGEKFWAGERGRGFVTVKQKGKKQTVFLTGHSHSEEQRMARARRRQWSILDADGWKDLPYRGLMRAYGPLAGS